MITFEHDKLHVKYVFITKITSNFVYVHSGRGDNGQSIPFEEGDDFVHLDMDVKKVRIHRSVFMRFKQYNHSYQFSTPRLATLNYYADIVISIETQNFDLITGSWGNPAEWDSEFDLAIPKIIERTQKAEAQGFQVLINGEDVFWLNKFDKDNYNILNADGNLRLYTGHAIKLFRIGVSRIRSGEDIIALQQKIAKGEAIDKKEISVNVLTGKMLGFIPNLDAPEDEQILALSPMLEAKKIIDKTVNLEERAAYSIGSESNPVYANIEFVLQAARVIGKLYGNEKNDFFDIPSILEETGVVNLTHITESSRRNVPINKSALECLSWLLGYIYREKDLHNMRELNRMFRFIMNSGLVAQNDVYIDRRKEAGLESRELPLNTERTNKVLEMLRNPAFEEDPMSRYKLKAEINRELADESEDLLIFTDVMAKTEVA